MSVLKIIYDNLKTNHFDVYFPSQHIGECKNEYVVVKQESTISELNVSSARPTYSILCYVPIDKYSSLEDLTREVRESMKQVYPIVMPTGDETPSFYDENVNGHMISIQYIGCRKIERY